MRSGHLSALGQCGQHSHVPPPGRAAAGSSRLTWYLLPEGKEIGVSVTLQREPYVSRGKKLPPVTRLGWDVAWLLALFFSYLISELPTLPRSLLQPTPSFSQTPGILLSPVPCNTRKDELMFSAE